MEELSLRKLLCKRQKLACSPIKPNRRHLFPIRCSDTIHHDWDWMLGCWHSAMLRDIIFKRHDPIILCVEVRINGESYNVFYALINSFQRKAFWNFSMLLIWRHFRKKFKIMRVRFSWLLSSLKKRVFLSKRFWTIAALNSSFLERLRRFLRIFLTIMNTMESEIYFFCTSLAIFWHGSFLKAFFVASFGL